MRILSDVAWILLLVITPWRLFKRFFLLVCEQAMEKRKEVLHNG